MEIRHHEELNFVESFYDRTKRMKNEISIAIFLSCLVDGLYIVNVFIIVRTTEQETHNILFFYRNGTKNGKCLTRI